MTDRDHARLAGVHPVLRLKVTQILMAMDVLGFPMFVVAGARSLAEQQALYAQGRTTPGHKVTNADGVKHKSNHQAGPDGLGYAVDCAFRDDPQTARIETWEAGQPWELYGLMGEKLGLVWGGRWPRLMDRPHLELPQDGPDAA